VSTGICGSLTFGRGKLDNLGYWEHDCKICEDAFYVKNPDLRGKNYD